MTTELATITPGADTLTIKSNVQAVQRLKAEVMVQDVHYGIIPGCKKPSLYQPGAETLLQLFQCGEGEPDVEELEHSLERIAYRVRVPIVHLATGTIVGHGMGEASTDEEKYRWRKVVCTEEFDETPEPQRRKAWKKKKEGGVYSAQQVRTVPADLANTILQMAEKRALVNATKTVTAVSDMFAQGLEDMPPGMADTGRPPPKMPQATQPTPTGNPGMISEPQRKRLFAICQSANVSQPNLKTYMENIHSISSTSDIPKGKIYEEICAWAEAGGKVAG